MPEYSIAAPAAGRSAQGNLNESAADAIRLLHHAFDRYGHGAALQHEGVLVAVRTLDAADLDPAARHDIAAGEIEEERVLIRGSLQLDGRDLLEFRRGGRLAVDRDLQGITLAHDFKRVGRAVFGLQARTDDQRLAQFLHRDAAGAEHAAQFQLTDEKAGKDILVRQRCGWLPDDRGEDPPSPVAPEHKRRWGPAATRIGPEWPSKLPGDKRRHGRLASLRKSGRFGAIISESHRKLA